MDVKIHEYVLFNNNLESILEKKEKVVINTINAHSYIIAKKDPDFKNALINCEVLLPDGEGIILMARHLKGKRLKKIAGADLHKFLIEHANINNLKCFYLGSSQNTLDLIRHKLSEQYENIKFGFFSPPFKANFSDEDNESMILQINSFNPDILFVGMTAPKQEKWVFQNRNRINSEIICSIGAVFDFIAETKKRAPEWVIKAKIEWLYRSFTEWRLTKRYLSSTPLFLLELCKLKFLPKRG